MNQKTLSISAVILFGEEDNFLEDTIASIKNQNDQILEIMVIDGSAHDRGERIAKDHPGIDYYHQPNHHTLM